MQRLEHLNPGSRVGYLVYAGDPLGRDLYGQEVVLAEDVVVTSIHEDGFSWLVTYHAVRVRLHPQSAA